MNKRLNGPIDCMIRTSAGTLLFVVSACSAGNAGRQAGKGQEEDPLGNLHKTVAEAPLTAIKALFNPSQATSCKVVADGAEARELVTSSLLNTPLPKGDQYGYEGRCVLASAVKGAFDAYPHRAMPLAAQHALLAKIRYLMDMGARPAAGEVEGVALDHFLWRCAEQPGLDRGFVRKMIKLLYVEADKLDYMQGGRYTPPCRLYAATSNGLSTVVVDALLAKGEKMDFNNMYWLMCKGTCFQFKKYLTLFPAFVHEKDSCRATLACHAVVQNQLEKLKWLQKKGDTTPTQELMAALAYYLRFDNTRNKTFLRYKDMIDYLKECAQHEELPLPDSWVFREQQTASGQ